MYAVLDIEATGGQMGEEEIIEIAVYRYDGEKVIDQLISLVRPERQIDSFVQRLTGITTKMVRTAPKFCEIAKRIIEITKDDILVGHNVDFDYRMLRQEFRKLGYNYEREVIDTVPLSEKYFPETSSHSLGKLCKELKIPTSDRHRASGDARATLALFKLLLEKDSVKNISKNGIKPKSQSNLPELGYKGLPNLQGIFYIQDFEKKVIFLMATKNMSQSARKLLNGKSELNRNLKAEFANVHYELTGNDLISKIKELNEIKKLKPKYNPTGINYTYAICLEKENDYKVLKVYKLTNQSKPLIEFEDAKKARSVLSIITSAHNLCPVLNGLSFSGSSCFSYEVGECKGACQGIEPVRDYNQRVEEFLGILNLKDKNFLIIGNGRNLGEKSFVWIENEKCKGYGYYEFHNQIKDVKTLTERMTPLPNDSDFIKIVKPFLAAAKYRELILLDSQ